MISSHFVLNVASEKSSSACRTPEWSAASLSYFSVMGQPTTCEAKIALVDNKRTDKR